MRISVNSVSILVNGQPDLQWNFSEYPQISKSSEIYLLFGQHSLDVQLFDFNSIHVWEMNIVSNHRYI